MTTVAEHTTEDLERMVRGPITGAVCGTPPAGVTAADWADLWFPEMYRVTAGPQKGQYTADTAMAVALCHMCPLMWTCRMGALAIEGDDPAANRYGVYGAMDPDDRWDLMVELNGGEPPSNRRYSPPSEDASVCRQRLRDAVLSGESPTAMDTRIADAVGLSPDTVQMIRTGGRKRIRMTTHLAIMAYFETPQTPDPQTRIDVETPTGHNEKENAACR